MMQMQICDIVSLMAKNKFDSEEFREQETVRFAPEERAKLNEVLQRTRRGAKGHIFKADLLKSLIGFPVGLTDEMDREYLGGNRETLPETEQMTGAGGGHVKASTGKRIGRREPHD
jgi:hypothetical protein